MEANAPYGPIAARRILLSNNSFPRTVLSRARRLIKGGAAVYGDSNSLTKLRRVAVASVSVFLSRSLQQTKPTRGDRRMENKPAQNIQDTFLNTVRKDKTPITIYLVSGVKLTGKIRSFDKYSVLLENNSQEQLIFKHAISTVVSNRSVLHSEHRAAMSAGGSSGLGGGAAAPPIAAPPELNPGNSHS
jgi:host factor-I protein